MKTLADEGYDQQIFLPQFMRCQPNPRLPPFEPYLLTIDKVPSHDCLIEVWIRFLVEYAK